MSRRAERRPPAARERAFLRRNAPFTRLRKAGLDALLHGSRVETYRAGETLYLEGARGDAFWVVLSGRVRKLRTGPDGRRSAVESVLPGEIVGLFCRLGAGSTSYPCTAVAAAACEALRVPDRSLRRAQKLVPALHCAMLSVCAARLEAAQRMRSLGEQPAAVRLAALLRTLHSRHGEAIPYSRDELAEETGIPPEAASRTLASLARRRVIRAEDGRIRVLRPAALKTVLRLRSS